MFVCVCVCLLVFVCMYVSALRLSSYSFSAVDILLFIRKKNISTYLYTIIRMLSICLYTFNTNKPYTNPYWHTHKHLTHTHLTRIHPTQTHLDTHKSNTQTSNTLTSNTHTHIQRMTTFPCNSAKHLVLDQFQVSVSHVNPETWVAGVTN